MLPTNISEDAQQSSASIKFLLHLWSPHVHASFASIENSVMSVTKNGFEEEQQLFSKRKDAKLFGNVANQLFNKLNISGIF